MDFLKLAEKRQSTRSYTETHVEKEKIEKCIEAARLAPSACNSQPWTFIVVDDKEKVEKIRNAVIDRKVQINKFASKTAVFVVIVLEKSNILARFGAEVKKREFRLIDIGIAAEHFCLQATELELGTCLIGWFNEQKVKEALDIPEKKRVALVITVGYPPEGYKLRKKKRKDKSKMCYYNSYGESK